MLEIGVHKDQPFLRFNIHGKTVHNVRLRFCQFLNTLFKMVLQPEIVVIQECDQFTIRMLDTDIIWLRLFTVPNGKVDESNPGVGERCDDRFSIVCTLVSDNDEFPIRI